MNRVLVVNVVKRPYDAVHSHGLADIEALIVEVLFHELVYVTTPLPELVLGLLFALLNEPLDYHVDFVLRKYLELDSKHFDLWISGFGRAEAQSINFSTDKQLNNIFLVLRIRKIDLELLLDVHYAVTKFLEKSFEISNGLRIHQQLMNDRVRLS